MQNSPPLEGWIPNLKFGRRGGQYDTQILNQNQQFRSDPKSRNMKSRSSIKLFRRPDFRQKRRPKSSGNKFPKSFLNVNEVLESKPENRGAILQFCFLFTPLHRFQILQFFRREKSVMNFEGFP